jgi:thiol-disulfide isomerase/thioredoxin
MRAVVIIAGLSLLIGLCLLFTACRRPAGTNDNAIPQTRAAGLAPEISLPDLAGQTVTLSELKGKVVVLDFWATWCPPCRSSLPHTQALSQSPEAKAGKLVVLAINQGESASIIQPFMQEQGYSFQVLLDTQQSTLRLYNPSGGIPTFVVIDREGRVAWKSVGFNKSGLDQALAAALAK